jgi:branched-chain amino acid transport system permease protein
VKLLTLILILLAALIPILLPNQPYVINTLTLTLCAMIPAIGLDLLFGHVGLLSLGQMGFAGVGGYTAALLLKQAGWNLAEAIAAATILAGIVGTLVGLPCLRLRSHYFVIVTLAVGIILFSLFNNLDWLTGGAQGLAGIPRPHPIGWDGWVIDGRRPTGFYWLTLATFLLVFLVQYLITRSPFGRSLAAIRQDETMAAARGVNVFAHKLVAFSLSAGMAGSGGALSISFLRVASPGMFDLAGSLNLVAIVVLGGPGFLAGPVVGALIFTAMPEMLRAAAEWRLVVFGTLLILIALFAPQGLLGTIFGMKRQGDAAHP